MSSEQAALVAIALVIAATAIGIYTENKKSSSPPSGQRRGHALAN